MHARITAEENISELFFTLLASLGYTGPPSCDVQFSLFSFVFLRHAELIGKIKFRCVCQKAKDRS